MRSAIARFLRSPFASLIAYALLAIIYTWPLMTVFGSHAPGDNGDSITNLWGFWYFPRSLTINTGSILHPDLQFYPDGISLTFTTCSAIGSILMAPVSLLAGPVAALNSWLLIHLIFGAWFFAGFCRMFGARRGAAFLAGYVYMASPFVAAHLPGHYSLVQIAFPAAALYALGRLFCSSRPGNTIRWKPALGLGLSVAGLVITDFYLSVMTFLVLLPAATLYFTILKRGRFPQKELALAVSVCLIAYLPWAVITWREMHGHDMAPYDRHIGNILVLRWKRLVNLPQYHYVWGPLLYGERSTSVAYFNEYTYLGVVAAITGWIGLLYSRRRLITAVWPLMFLLILGLGGGNRFTPEPEWSWGPLAFGRFWPDVFPFSEFRVPSRWLFALVAVNAIMMALGLTAILRRWKPKPSLKTTAGLAFLALLIFDHQRFPMPVFPATPIKSELDKAGALRPDGVALDFPIGLLTGQGNNWGQFESGTLRRQMSHGMKLFSGHVSRYPNDLINARRADPDFSWLVAAQNDEATSGPEPNWKEFAEKYSIHAVRIPMDLSTSESLYRIARSMNPGWTWTKSEQDLVGY